MNRQAGARHTRTTLEPSLMMCARENVRLAQENQVLRQSYADLTTAAETWIRLYESALARANAAELKVAAAGSRRSRHGPPGGWSVSRDSPQADQRAGGGRRAGADSRERIPRPKQINIRVGWRARRRCSVAAGHRTGRWARGHADDYESGFHCAPGEGVQLIDQAGRAAYAGPYRTPVLPRGWAPLTTDQQRAVLQACDAAPNHLTFRLGSLTNPEVDYRVYQTAEGIVGRDLGGGALLHGL